MNHFYLDVAKMETDSNGQSLEVYKQHSGLMIVRQEGDEWVGHTKFCAFRFKNVDPALLEPVRETLEDLTRVTFNPASGRFGVGGDVA